MILPADQIKVVNAQLSRLIESSRNVMLIQGETLSLNDPIIKMLVIRAFDAAEEQITAVVEAVDEMATSGKIYDHAVEQYNIAVLVDDVVRTMQLREERARVNDIIADIIDVVSADVQAEPENNHILAIIDNLDIELVVDGQDPQQGTSDDPTESVDNDYGKEMDDMSDENDVSILAENESADVGRALETALYMEIDLSSLGDSSVDVEENDDVHEQDEDDEDWVFDEEDSEPDPPLVEQRERKLPTFSQTRQTFSSGDE